MRYTIFYNDGDRRDEVGVWEDGSGWDGTIGEVVCGLNVANDDIETFFSYESIEEIL